MNEKQMVGATSSNNHLINSKPLPYATRADDYIVWQEQYALQILFVVAMVPLLLRGQVRTRRLKLAESL